MTPDKKCTCKIIKSKDCLVHGEYRALHQPFVNANPSQLIEREGNDSGEEKNDYGDLDKDAVIKAIEEGAEEWQHEAEDIALALYGLVILKDIKDKPNKTESEIKQYEMSKPEAWEEARKVLQRTQAGQRIKNKMQPYLDFLQSQPSDTVEAGRTAAANEKDIRTPLGKVIDAAYKQFKDEYDHERQMFIFGGKWAIENLLSGQEAK